MFSMFKNLFSQDNGPVREALSVGAFLVDVRTPAEFSEGSVKGAVNIPLDEIPNQISKFKNKSSVVVFCRSGARSSQAKGILDKNGIQHVINGGTWQNVSQLVNE